MQNAEMPNWFLQLTVPSHARFVETVCELTGAVTSLTHCGSDDARDIAQAVNWTITRAVEASAGNGREIQVRFERRNDALEIGVRFADREGAAAGAPDSCDAAQGGRDPLSHLMDRVEFSREQDLIVCRMSRRLPRL